MNIYYKAVRPDGTAFVTGKHAPKIGRWMRRIPGDLAMCSRGYHVSDAPGETLIGGSWPCRLFEVEIPEGDWKRVGHKLVVPTYRAIRELSSLEALGPNGAGVVAIIEQAKELTPEQVAWDAARDAAWAAARAAAWAAARAAAWAAARDAARAGARDAAWAAAWDAAWAAAWAAAWDAAGAATMAAVRAAAWAAAWDAAWVAAWDAARAAARAAAWAAAGAVVRDIITTAHYDALMGPWREMVAQGS